MRRLKGDIEANGTTIFRDIEIMLDESVSPHSGLQSWGGSFILPGWQHLDSGIAYRLNLKDGRSGDFIITRLNPGTNHSTYVTFVGDGSLA